MNLNPTLQRLRRYSTVFSKVFAHFPLTEGPVGTACTTPERIRRS